jgi:secreted PhoX family phosphatase
MAFCLLLTSAYSVGQAAENVGARPQARTVDVRPFTSTGPLFYRCTKDRAGDDDTDPCVIHLTVTADPKNDQNPCQISVRGFVQVGAAESKTFKWKINHGDSSVYYFVDNKGIELQLGEQDGFENFVVNKDGSVIHIDRSNNMPRLATYLVHIFERSSGKECQTTDPIIVNEG